MSCAGRQVGRGAIGQISSGVIKRQILKLQYFRFEYTYVSNASFFVLFIVLCCSWCSYKYKNYLLFFFKVNETECQTAEREMNFAFILLNIYDTEKCLRWSFKAEWSLCFMIYTIFLLDKLFREIWNWFELPDNVLYRTQHHNSRTDRYCPFPHTSFLFYELCVNKIRKYEKQKRR